MLIFDDAHSEKKLLTILTILFDSYIAKGFIIILFSV